MIEREDRLEPLGPAAILRQHPFSQPAKTKKSPAPLVHAASKGGRSTGCRPRPGAVALTPFAARGSVSSFRKAGTYSGQFARAFREAAESLRAGDRLARFPRGCFPPGLPFVRAGRLAISPAT